MKRIALYGYGNYGKKAAESFLRFWGNEYAVTGIFDEALSGRTDRCWNIRILPPDRLQEEYGRGTFESVMICIYDKDTQTAVRTWIGEKGIPVFFPGNESDFAGADSFCQEEDPGIVVREHGYSLHVYKKMLGALADYNRRIMFLFNEEGKVNVDNCKRYMHYFKPYMLSYPFRLKDPIPERVSMNGDYCLIAKTYSTNYGHFTLEIADGVYLLENAGYTGKYIINETPFSRELMHLLGVTDERLVSIQELEGHKVYVFERLWDINHDCTAPMTYSKTVLPRMAGLIKERLKRDDGYPRRIYVKRIGTRKLLNSEETVIRNGFQVIIPEEYSLTEQMNLFYNADIVLCPHGANSTNYLYMHKGAVFAEIFSDRWHMDVNSGVCRANGVHYLQRTGKAVVAGASSDMRMDYTIGEGALLDLIREAEAKLECSSV